MAFRGHYEGRNLGQLDLFKALLPLLPALAVSLCRPLVTSPTPTVMDDAQRLLLAHYELGPLERGRALVHCTSLGDRTPREMLQYMRSLQPGEQEGVMFRYVFVSLFYLMWSEKWCPLWIPWMTWPTLPATFSKLMPLPPHGSPL